MATPDQHSAFSTFPASGQGGRGLPDFIRSSALKASSTDSSWFSIMVHSSPMVPRLSRVRRHDFGLSSLVGMRRAVTETGFALEAQLENPDLGTYHGYPMPETDPLSLEVIRRWRGLNG